MKIKISVTLKYLHRECGNTQESFADDPRFSEIRKRLELLG